MTYRKGKVKILEDQKKLQLITSRILLTNVQLPDDNKMNFKKVTKKISQSVSSHFNDLLWRQWRH